jgi:hypothetical protein
MFVHHHILPGVGSVVPERLARSFPATAPSAPPSDLSAIAVCHERLVLDISQKRIYLLSKISIKGHPALKAKFSSKAENLI